MEYAMMELQQWAERDRLGALKSLWVPLDGYLLDGGPLDFDLVASI